MASGKRGRFHLYHRTIRPHPVQPGDRRAVALPVNPRRANDGQLDSNTVTVTITVQAVAQADVFLSGMRASKSARISGTGTVGVTATGSGDTTSQTASVSLTAAYDAAVVSVVNPAPVSKTMTPGMSTKFGFTPTVTCLVPGVKTSITWTATISAPQNRDTTNDVRTAATAVTCR